MGRLTVLTGGARSGKSGLALRLAERADSDGWPVAFIATCPAIEGDADLTTRIADHRAERPSHWTTIEAEIDLGSAIDRAGDDTMIVIDCLTLWVSNLMFQGTDEAKIMELVEPVLAAVGLRSAPTVVVTNEVGFGIVPDNELSRTYRDQLGRVNQAWVAAADEALLMVAGRALPLVDPVGLVEPYGDGRLGAQGPQ